MKVIVCSLPAAFVATLLCVVMYVVAQQGIRRGADEPQDAIAHELASRAAAGTAAFPQSEIDLARSHLPFVQLYGPDGSLAATQAVLDGRPIAIPRGVLDVARKNGRNAVTWQPRPGVREAAVVVSFSGLRSGFILAGRSLDEAESRKAAVARIIGAAWVVSLLLSVVLTAVADRFRSVPAV